MISLEKLTDGSVTARNFDKLATAVNHPVPQARVYNSANIAVVTATLTALTFNSERFDEGGLHSTASNTGRLTAPVAGLYAFGGQVQWAVNAVGQRGLRLILNGTTNLALVAQMTLTDGNEMHQQITTLYRLVPGDYVEVHAYQNSGGNLNVAAAGNYSPEFWMTRIAGYTNIGLE